MKEQPRYLVLDKRQSLGESLVCDAWTYGLLLLCIWVSQGSRWWTFLTGVMFLTFLLARVAAVVSTRQHKFKDLAELAAWVEREQSASKAEPR